jgi:quercetin dioxygenase-like cupin family protein
MPRVRVVHGDDVPWMGPAGPDAGPGRLVELAADDDGAGTRLVHPGADGGLQLQDVRFPPGAVVEPHAHRVDEIMFVTAGSLRLGARVLACGDSLYIPAATLYGFRVGDDGARLLLFRGTADSTRLSKADLVAGRVGGEGS